MNNEQIKEIIIAMLNNKQLHISSNNEETAKEIAKTIKTLREETNN